MDTVIETTRQFEKDLKKMGPVDRKTVERYIERVIENFSSNHDLFSHEVKLAPIRLNDNLRSSLYLLRAGSHLRVLFTIDDDPIFDQRRFLLLRIAKSPEEYPKIFSQLAKSLYQKNLLGYGDAENDAD